MADIGKIEYRVRAVTRYQVTCYWESASGEVGECKEKGEYDNERLAHEVAYALCKDEHQRLGFAPGDERIVYPEPNVMSARADNIKRAA